MKIVAVSIVLFFQYFLVAGLPLFAAPIPPLLVVNHETKECATIMGGDECMDCYPPEGWEILGFAGENECPAGYAQLDELGSVCEHFKDEFCCSEGHSGVHGDCEDMVLHGKRKQCAFVDDVHTAVLPEGWDKKPEDMLNYDWACPLGYEWVASLDVPEEEPSPTAEVKPSPTPEVVGEGTGSEGGGLPCPGAALMGPVVLGLLLLRRRDR